MVVTFVPETHGNTAYQKTRLYLPGQLFDPATQKTAACKVLHLWPGGADLQCGEESCLGPCLILYTTGFGRFEGRVLSRANGKIELEFIEGKRTRLIEKLAAFAKNGFLAATQLRKHPRMLSLTTGTITRQNGDKINCEVLDISLEGVSLKTTERPPIGEIVMLGRNFGRLIRHHSDGIAIQYVKAQGKELAAQNG